MLILLACTSETPQVVTPALPPEPTIDELREWPMPEGMAINIPAGTMPQLPEPPPVVVNPDGSIDAVDRLMYLVAYNPVPEVNTRFLKRINDHDIFLIPGTRRGNYATFGLEKGEALVLPPELPKDALYPIFAYNSERVARIDSPRKALEAMLIVYHESVHDEQWSTATDPNERASFGGVEFARVPPEVCSYIYANELEAYHRMCLKAVEWDMPDFWQCVPVMDDALFKHVVFLMVRMGQGQVNPECVSTWAAQAGHPKPSVYDVP